MFLLQKQSQIHKPQRDKAATCEEASMLVSQLSQASPKEIRPSNALPRIFGSFVRLGERSAWVLSSPRQLAKHCLDDVPHIFGGVAELAASNAGAQTEVTDTDSVVLERICKVIISLGHCADKHADALL